MKRLAEGETMAGAGAIGSARGWDAILCSLRAGIARAFAKIGVNRHRTLRLCESLSLGDKRLVAVIECDRQRFLLAATPQNISLLQSLGPAQSEERQGN